MALYMMITHVTEKVIEDSGTNSIIQYSISRLAL